MRQRYAWCVQCGPLDQTDEDECCRTCGADATGPGADAAGALLEACEAVVRVFASKGSLTQAVIDCDNAIAKARGQQ